MVGSNARIVLGNSSLARYPEAGGLWSLYLPYLLGLDALGHDVLWLELVRSSRDRDRDRDLAERFFERFAAYGVAERCALLLFDVPESELTIDAATCLGRSAGDVRAFVQSADVLWNLCGALRQPLLSAFRRRVFVDLDPGHLQVSALDWDLGLGEHQAFLTVGTKVGEPDCDVPTLGLAWHPFPPLVHLPMWEPAPDPGPAAPFNSVTQWNWGELWWGERVLSISKRDAYLCYLDLPRRCGRPFELAANIHPDHDTGDCELLRGHGWDLVHPYEVAESPEAYRGYIRRSWAEFSCPKPIFRELGTGWFSDRSACYLAAGRPILAEDTGFGDHLPTGAGLIAFRDLDEAIAGVTAIDADYGRHRQAARGLAETYLDARRTLPRMLAASDA